MLAAFALARAFTLAVVAKKTLLAGEGEDDEDNAGKKAWMAGIVLIAAFCFTNIIAFR